jgi:charged multivesicular body protein 4
MSSWLSYITGRRDTKIAARDAIVTLRQQLSMLEKKEEYLKKKIDEETAKARQNSVNNKSGKL